MRIKLLLLILLIFSSSLLLACNQTNTQDTIPITITDDYIADKNIDQIQLPGKFHNSEEENQIDLETLPLQFLSDGTPYLIHPDKLEVGGPHQDGIPAIDNPQFESVKKADEWIQEEDIVFYLNYNGVEKVYPSNILLWHEIVNDYANELAIAITLCPVCITGVAYERVLDNEEITFGTSGRLFNSNTIMYDKNSGSYWSLVEGISIIGAQSGKKLTQLPLDIIFWKEVKELHPNAQVLSRETGFQRNYSHKPYISYFTDDAVDFPKEFKPFKINTKETIYGIEKNEQYIAYKEEDATPEIKLQGEKMYWYNWYALHPQTILFEK